MIQEYKRITFKYVCIIVIIFVFLFGLGSYREVTVSWLIYWTLAMGLVVRETRKRLDIYLNRIKRKLRSDMDVEYVTDVYEEVISKEYLIGRHNVLCNYFLLLLDTCQFEKLWEKYKYYRRMMRSRHMWIYLNTLLLELSSLLNDRSEYLERLSRYRFSEYYNKKGKLGEIESAQRFQDRTMEIRQLYEKKEYQQVIQKVEQIKATHPWSELYLKSIKERCLYHLNSKYSIPQQEQTKYLFVKQWDVLVRTGEEYYDERVCELFNMIKKDFRISCIKYVTFIIVFTTVAMCWYIFN